MQRFIIYCHGNMERMITVSILTFMIGLKEKKYKIGVYTGHRPPFPALLADGTLWVFLCRAFSKDLFKQDL